MPVDRGRKYSARQVIACIAIAVLVLVVFGGRSLRKQGDQMRPGWERSMVLAAGNPAGWVADQLPLADVGHTLTAWLSPNEDLVKGGGFDQTARGPVRPGGVEPVTADAFDPAALGGRAPAPRPLRTLLITGDSMAMPLDAHMARRLAGAGSLKVIRDPHVGTGISETQLLDWGRLSRTQALRERPDAVVMFMGANEGFPMNGINCCGPAWAAEYATRARQMMATYRRDRAGRIYWLLLPAPRDAARRKIAATVNAALRVAAAPYGAQVRIIDTATLFTPGFRFRAAMPIGGRGQIVRDPDGIHLNDRGAELAAGVVLAALRRDFRMSS